nr:nucleoside triphosphate pyrophosphohydrolase family protein [Clostridium neonatale]
MDLDYIKNIISTLEYAELSIDEMYSLIDAFKQEIEIETGEVIDIIKKYLYQGHELNKEHVTEELGDVMFYITNLATLLGIDMQDVLQNNVDKLLKRYPNGFEKEKSVNR